MTTIQIPTPLRPYAGGNGKIAVSGETVGAALNELTTQFPELKNHLYEGDTLRSFVNVYLGEDDVRYLQGEETAVSNNDTLMIIPSIAGGLGRHT